MVFVKLVKNKAYFKRYQVKYRRRREGKTDYHARRALVAQEKRKYDAQKYRFVVRFSNKRIVCQVVYSTIKGDVVVGSASSDELKRFGIPVGLTNYPSAYCTGLLAARRVLKKLKIDDEFKGVEVADGNEYHVEENIEERRPFKCILDIGIIRTTTGNRVFGAMKGACDGGLHIPHTNVRFPGFNGKKKEGTYDAEKHRERIYGIHISNYMKEMNGENPDKYDSHFSQFIKAGIKPGDIEEMYRAAHQKIRSSPDRERKQRVHEPIHMRQGTCIKTSKGSYRRLKKLSCEQRKERVFAKMAMVAEQLQEEQ